MIKKTGCIFLAAIVFFFVLRQFLRHRIIPELPFAKTNFVDSNGEKFNPENRDQPYLVISFFQSWCGDCIRETPSIENLQKIIGPEKLEVAMVSDEPFEKIQKFKNMAKSDLDFYRSEKKLKDLNIFVYPTTYLIDKNGQIILSKLEGFDWSDKTVIDLIK
jgi:thiol-disulfide isomerase/thioredoxin